MSLFCIKSLFNHRRHENVIVKFIQPELVFIYAAKDIRKGKELFIDYCGGVQELQ